MGPLKAAMRKDKKYWKSDLKTDLRMVKKIGDFVYYCREYTVAHIGVKR